MITAFLRYRSGCPDLRVFTLQLPGKLYCASDLAILDLGKNSLVASTDNLSVLRRNKKLKSLNFAGNTRICGTDTEWDKLREQLHTAIPSLHIFNSRPIGTANKRTKHVDGTAEKTNKRRKRDQNPVGESANEETCDSATPKPECLPPSVNNHPKVPKSKTRKGKDGKKQQEEEQEEHQQQQQMKDGNKSRVTGTEGQKICSSAVHVLNGDVPQFLQRVEDKSSETWDD